MPTQIQEKYNDTCKRSVVYKSSMTRSNHGPYHITWEHPLRPSTISCGGGRACYNFVMPAKSNKEKYHPDLEEGEINDLSGATQASKTQELNRGGDVQATSEGGDADSTAQPCTDGMEVPLGVEGASDQRREREKHPPLPLAAAVGVEAMAPCSRMSSFVVVFDELLTSSRFSVSGRSRTGKVGRSGLVGVGCVGRVPGGIWGVVVCNTQDIHRLAPSSTC